MTRPTLEIVIEDAGLYVIVRDSNETLDIIGPIDDRDALMNAVVERWPNVDHIDLSNSN